MKIEHGKSSGVWKTSHPVAPAQITHHFRHFPPGSDYARRENWIFRLSKPHKPVARVSGTFLVAFFVQKWTLILLSNLTFHSTCKKGPEHCVGTLSGGTGLLMPITIVQVGVKRSMIKTHKKERLAYSSNGCGAPLKQSLSQKSIKWKQVIVPSAHMASGTREYSKSRETTNKRRESLRVMFIRSSCVRDSRALALMKRLCNMHGSNEPSTLTDVVTRPEINTN